MTEPGRCCVAHSIRLAIITVPKVASTSIKLALMRTDGIRGEFTVPQIHATAPSMSVKAARSRGYSIAIFVRHPYMRLASAWADRLVGRVAGETRLSKRRLGFDPQMTFDEFVAHVDDVGPCIEIHLLRQVDFIDRLGPRFIGKFERLASEWKRLSKIKPGLAPIQITNKSENDKPAFSAATKATIKRIYAEDFSRFGYR